MAARTTADVVVSISTPSLGSHKKQEQPSSSASQGSTSFVRTIDQKARQYLRAFERSLSFSSAGELRDEDSSSVTIEFLKARLHAQRVEYKAEKQKAQRLAQQVLELQQRLNTEIERRKKAELSGFLVSTKHVNKLRSSHSDGDRIDLCKHQETSSEKCQSDCEENIFLVSSSSFLHRLKISHQERQQMTSQHDLFSKQDIDEDLTTNKEPKVLEEARGKQDI